MTSFTLLHEVVFTCEGTYVPGANSKFDRFFERHVEPIGPDVKDFRVSIVSGNSMVDVTGCLHRDTLNELKNDWVLNYEESSDADLEYENDDAS